MKRYTKKILCITLMLLVTGLLTGQSAGYQVERLVRSIVNNIRNQIPFEHFSRRLLKQEDIPVFIDKLQKQPQLRKIFKKFTKKKLEKMMQIQIKKTAKRARREWEKLLKIARKSEKPIALKRLKIRITHKGMKGYKLFIYIRHRRNNRNSTYGFHITGYWSDNRFVIVGMK